MLLRLDEEQMRGFGCGNEQRLPSPGAPASGKRRLQDPHPARRRRRMPGGQAVPGVAWKGSVAQWARVWALE